MKPFSNAGNLLDMCGGINEKFLLTENVEWSQPFKFDYILLLLFIMRRYIY